LLLPLGKQKVAVTESGVMKGIIGPKRQGGTRGWRKLRIKKFHNFSSQIYFTVIKSGAVRNREFKK
jgi:hypothetical protein